MYQGAEVSRGMIDIVKILLFGQENINRCIVFRDKQEAWAVNSQKIGYESAEVVT